MLVFVLYALEKDYLDTRVKLNYSFIPRLGLEKDYLDTRVKLQLRVLVYPSVSNFFGSPEEPSVRK
jgi:hypothetical protein